LAGVTSKKAKKQRSKEAKKQNDRKRQFGDCKWGIKVDCVATGKIGALTRAWCVRFLMLGCLLGVGLLAGCKSAPPQHGLNEKQIAALKDAGFKQTDKGWEFGLSDKVLFETDRSEISAAARQVIARVAHTLADVGISSVRVYGYTDSTGGDAYNERLSRQRANAVADALVEAGTPRNGIEAVGAGKQNPVADNGTAEGRAQNRRVAIVISTR
jgi:outer membrane protein OmpA-like peptidoglycan-associated protein